jgi:hypothetical protein
MSHYIFPVMLSAFKTGGMRRLGEVPTDGDRRNNTLDCQKSEIFFTL